MSIPGTASDRIRRWVYTVYVFILSLIPFWIWLSLYTFTNPEGFWQKAFMFGIGVYFGGAIQIACLFVFFYKAVPDIWNPYHRAKRDVELAFEKARRPQLSNIGL